MNKRLRYYLRGIGIGMTVTALILSIAGAVRRSQYEMSDADVIARAKELGMVDAANYSLTDASDSAVADTELPESVTPDLESDDTVSDTTANATADVAGIENEGTESVGLEMNAAESGDSLSTVGVAESTDNSDAVDTANVNAETQKDTASNGVLTTDENIAQETQKIEVDLSDATPALTTEESTITIKSGSGSETVAKILADAHIIDSAAAFDRYLEQNGYSRRIHAGTFTIPSGADYEAIAKIITGK